MTTFDDRERAAEGKFVHDEEIMFRAHARRDRQLGLWAGQLMHKSAAESQLYAESLISTEVMQGGDNSVVSKVLKDLAKVGIIKAETEIRSKMAVWLAEALLALRNGG